ncbi:beta-lactamase family protein [Rheinheimera sp. UJ51]|uniref:serine hydrolase domain-containing protein n=1 Tax=Rheinheimera sp. UJ51 TaxID=2892446 RepID=UPI001E316E80|nr:serine hydrolase domain-containing protein [Rheinheimera sp. UJ51]MCC5450434.1 beta-lactamase family protein [Rheinheimera sp. UJ51]
MLKALCGLLCLGASFAAFAEPSPEQLKEFDQFFQEQVQQQQVPGAAYAIVYKNKIIRAKGFGVREVGSKLPVDAFTVFRIASVSKTFAGGLASILASQGHFKWDDPVNRYLPDFSFKTRSFNNKLKVEHLLSQSTGVIANAYDNLIEANFQPERILPQFQKLDPLCTPGQCYGYQNVLFSLIEPIMQQSTSQDYASLLRQNIFEPLHMPTASVGYQGFLDTENRAIPHVKAKGKWYPRTVSESYYRFAPAAGVNASAIDLGYWLIAQLGYNPEVLNSEQLQYMTNKRVRTVRDLRRRQWREHITDAHYALGWRVYQFGQEQLVYHGGWVQGFRAELAYSKDRELGLVILLNAESNVVAELSTHFWSTMFTAMQKEDKASLLAGCKLPEKNSTKKAANC